MYPAYQLPLRGCKTLSHEEKEIAQRELFNQDLRSANQHKIPLNNRLINDRGRVDTVVENIQGHHLDRYREIPGPFEVQHLHGLLQYIITPW